MSKYKVLILCTGNSCRSQMAEGILKHLAGDVFEVASAGSKPVGFVHPLAIEVMSEIGIDISNHKSKPLEPFLDAGIGTVVTVCGNADQACPAFMGNTKRYHWAFDDPPHAALPGESEKDAFRRVRDEIYKVFAAFTAGYRQALSEQP